MVSNGRRTLSLVLVLDAVTSSKRQQPCLTSTTTTSSRAFHTFKSHHSQNNNKRIIKLSISIPAPFVLPYHIIHAHVKSNQPTQSPAFSRPILRHIKPIHPYYQNKVDRKRKYFHLKINLHIKIMLTQGYKTPFRECFPTTCKLISAHLSSRKGGKKNKRREKN